MTIHWLLTSFEVPRRREPHVAAVARNAKLGRPAPSTRTRGRARRPTGSRARRLADTAAGWLFWYALGSAAATFALDAQLLRRLDLSPVGAARVDGEDAAAPAAHATEKV